VALQQTVARLAGTQRHAAFCVRSPDAVGEEQRAALQQAFAFAAQEQPIGEPLDWMNSVCPSRWKLRGETVEFDWFGDEGVFGNAGL
jgi:alpha-galactosidase